MREQDKPGSSFRRTPLKRFASGSRRSVMTLGFGASVAVISLAGIYAIYGASADRKLDTGNNSHQIKQSKEAIPETRTSEGGSVKTDTDQSGDASNSSQSTTTVTVNGQQVEVPANGESRQSIDSTNSHTEITVQSNHSNNSSAEGNNASNSSSSSVNLNVTTNGAP